MAANTKTKNCRRESNRKIRRQTTRLDLVDEILKPTLARLEVRDVVVDTIETSIDALSEVRNSARTLPAENLALVLRCVVDHLLASFGQVLSSCCEELEEPLPQREPHAGAARSMLHRILSDENLHALGESDLFSNGSQQGPALDDAFFERLEKSDRSGAVALDPLARGILEGYLRCFWFVCQNPEENKRHRRRAKRTASLGASIDASGTFKVEKFRSLTQEPVSVNVPTARSIGVGLGITKAMLHVFGKTYEKVVAEKQRTSEARLKKRRGSAADTDWLLALLANSYDLAGGAVRMSWADKEKKDVGGPFARFLFTFWEVLPPAARPRRPQTFARRAKDTVVPKFSAQRRERARLPQPPQIEVWVRRRRRWQIKGRDKGQAGTQN